MAADPFAAQAPLDAYLGQPVVVHTTPEHDYRGGVLDLEVRARRVYPNRGEVPASDPASDERYASVRFRNEIARSSKGVASNAFGVQREVTLIDSDSDAILLTNRRYDSAYRHRIRADGPAAKNLANDVVFTVEGRIARTEGGKIGGCSKDGIAPTLSAPTGVLFHTCWVAVEIDRATLRLRSSGAVLRTWVPDSPEASILDQPEPEAPPN